MLSDSSKCGSMDSFRVETCIKMEERCDELYRKSVKARIGHVFGEESGLFPFLKLASLFRVKSLGSGKQYIPWIHVEDVANSLYHMAVHPTHFEGRSVNVASP